MSDEPLTTTAADLSRHFGLWQDRAMSAPVMVTHHGRPRAVLISVEQYHHYEAGQGRAAAAALAENFNDAAILDRISQGFVALDRDLVVLRLNHAATSYLGRSADHVLGKPLALLYPALMDATRSRIFAQVMRTGERISFEAPSSIYPDQFVRIDAFPHADGVGFLFHAVADAESQRQSSGGDALKALLAVALTVGTARISLRGTFARIDESLLAIIGGTAEALLSTPLIEIIAMPDRAALTKLMETVFEGHGAAAMPLAVTALDGTPLLVTLALAETRTAFAIDGAELLIVPRAPGK